MQQWIKLASETTGEEQNVLLPAIYDIVWGGLSFLIVLVLFAKFVMPTMRKLQQREPRKLKVDLPVPSSHKLKQVSYLLNTVLR